MQNINNEEKEVDPLEEVALTEVRERPNVCESCEG